MKLPDRRIRCKTGSMEERRELVYKLQSMGVSIGSTTLCDISSVSDYDTWPFITWVVNEELVYVSSGIKEDDPTLIGSIDMFLSFFIEETPKPIYIDKNSNFKMIFK